MAADYDFKTTFGTAGVWTVATGQRGATGNEDRGEGGAMVTITLVTGTTAPTEVAAFPMRPDGVMAAIKAGNQILRALRIAVGA